MASKAFLIVAMILGPTLAYSYKVGGDSDRWKSGDNYTEWAKGKVRDAIATNYVVGDEAGWKVGVNYTAWAEGKTFRVGDTLVFMYTSGNHNVMKVDGADFQKCASSNASAKPLTSGNDVITLATPGKKWYICNVADHCSKGMKLVITVFEAEAPAPAPAPLPGSSTPPPPGTSAASGISISPLKYNVWMLAAMALSKMVMT
ncbi:UNVERIFIED_CONTAM: Uclacyanin-3 [Sesamum angustifolium]|uniref:Uclacyanin-3 n=1 Tax=Sesamum angustifolium TaxID=2727405 RepID=A0AAW2IJE8_9LAMI